MRSHAVMSVRQRVGNKESQALSRNVCPRTGARAIPQAIPQVSALIYLLLPHMTKYPGPIPPYLHTASLQLGTKLHQFLSLFLLFTAAFCTTLAKI